MKTNFNVLFEDLLGRYQQGGYLIGDRVRFKKDCLNLEFFKSKGTNVLDVIKSCMQPGFDLNLRIAALKSVYPTTTQNYRGGTESPDNIYADVIIEYAPGLYRNPMTVPIESLELQDDGINRGPVPDSTVYKNKEQQKPKEISADSSANFDINLTDKNTVIPGGKKWNDNVPGAGNAPTKKY
jgi:hypothetical protein